jgi:hypothetical protein
MTGERLTSRQLRVAEALLREGTQKAAAERAGVSVRTVQRMLADPSFEAAMSQLRREAFQHALVRIQALASDATEVIRSIATDESEAASVRVRAAQILLDLGRYGFELLDVSQRIARLETAVAKGTQ